MKKYILIQKQLMLICLTILSLINFSHSFAKSAAGSLQVNTTLTSTCSVNSDNVNFGLLSNTTDSTTSSNLYVFCTKNTPYTLSMNSGIHYDTSHRLIGAVSGALISYALCTHAAAESCGGTGNGTWLGYPDDPVKFNYTGTGATQTYPIFGILSSSYDVPDSYSDIITITVSY